jgi:hypothetical protein
MKRLTDVVELAQDGLLQRLRYIVDVQMGLGRDQYIRYLSTQYHLNKGVQKHFYTVASHSSLIDRVNFRKFLLKFANEEELHYEVARRDLKNMGARVLPLTLDVKLWWAYFDSIIKDRPFVRMGACLVLESIAGKSSALVREMLDDAAFADKNNTRFIVIHLHEGLPHGDQVLAALKDNVRTNQELDDCLVGAQDGMVQYLRMIDSALWPGGVPFTVDSVSGSGSKVSLLL